MSRSLSTRTVALAAFVASLLLLTVLPATAQEPAAADQAATSAELIGRAYEISKTADTLEQYREVLALCRQAEQRTDDEASRKYIEKLKAWSHNRIGESYAEQASQAMDQGQPEQAAELDKKALEEFEKAVELDETRWKAVHNRGVSYAVAGDYDAAVADFARVMRLNPQYSNAWFNRGEIRYEQGQYEDAVEDYSQAVRLRPDDAGAYTSRGHAYFQLRRFREALQDYNQAVRLQPDNALSYTDRADAYRSLGMWEQAARDYRRAIQLDNQLARAYQNAAWLMATSPEARYRDAQLALESAQRAIELEGEPDYRNLDTLAAAQANAQQFEAARETLVRALQLAPDDQVEALQQRLELYEANRPYRERVGN